MHDVADWLSLQVLIEKGKPAPSPLTKCFELEIHKINVMPLIHRVLSLVAYSLGVVLASVARVRYEMGRDEASDDSKIF